ncbi:NUDIX domain-containing protein [Thalassospira mesophila]|uniref:NUDIX domain-containing protein n=1 Tax=Thalassospira mesophila TaxID=1293891 RepID=UPI000A1E24FB|nr:NUDIX domain-containing protein [Thalassospira mesophila]
MIGPIFGNPEPGKAYDIQDCAYAVIPDGKGMLGVVKTPKGIMLVGGGVERGETGQGALCREAIEETGCPVKIVSRLGIATQYVNNRTKNKYRLKRAVFFIAEIQHQTTAPIDLDHEFMWMPALKVVDSLVRPFHRWAAQHSLEIAIRKSGIMDDFNY